MTKTLITWQQGMGKKESRTRYRILTKNSESEEFNLFFLLQIMRNAQSNRHEFKLTADNLAQEKNLRYFA